MGPRFSLTHSVGDWFVRLVLLLLLAVSPFAPEAYAQQATPSYPPPTHSPHTYTPQTFSPPGYSPQGFTPQTKSGDAQARPTPRRRLFQCVPDEDQEKYCAFYSSRALQSGSECTCNGKQGSIY
jgi:hypothetical protein